MQRRHTYESRTQQRAGSIEPDAEFNSDDVEWWSGRSEAVGC